jgi:ATP-dependent RNA helicase DeaD
MLFTGAEFRVRPGDLVGALANELDIPGNRIGRVIIHDRKSFVGLPRAIADKALAERNSLPVRGRPVRIAMAHPQHQGPSRGAPPGGDQPFKGKPKGKGKSKFKAKGALKGKRRGSVRGAQAAA